MVLLIVLFGFLEYSGAALLIILDKQLLPVLFTLDVHMRGLWCDRPKSNVCTNLKVANCYWILFSFKFQNPVKLFCDL